MKVKVTLIICASFAITSLKAFSQDFIEPPTVLVPGGSFYMGSDRGSSDEKPVRKVTVPTFQMAKYEVTYKEFELFATETDYKMEENCYQYVLGGPFRQKRGSWDNNIYKFGDYYPVVCIPLEAAQAYASWLSKKTGKNYRLPTEAEWEYALRAGTSSRFHFGDSLDKNKACEYGNVSDWYAAQMSEKLFEGASVAEVEQCNDNEATLSTVGLYKPNQFGIYDLVGNAQEYLQDCYFDNYENAPIDGTAVTSEKCEQIVVRGGSWHWYPFTSSQRYALPKGTVGALEGIRLVLDTDGKMIPAQTGSPKFVKQLAAAQLKAKNHHLSLPSIPKPPQGLKVIKASNSEVKLQWLPNIGSFISGYKIYRQDPVSNEVLDISKVLTNTNFTDTQPLPYNARYFVVALNGKIESYKSSLVDSRLTTAHAVPSLIQAESYNVADTPDIRFSSMEPEENKIIMSLNGGTATYLLDVTDEGSYLVDARIYHKGSSQLVKLWLGDRLIKQITVDDKHGWKTIENLHVNLNKGLQNLRIEGENESFALNWLNISLSKEN